MKISDSDDVKIFQNELNIINEWAELNSMVFNNIKFDQLEYSAHPQSNLKIELYTKEGLIIQKRKKVKDLGVIMRENGSFDSHIAQGAVRAKRQTNWILRTFRSKDTLCMKTLLKSTVLPIVEYCSHMGTYKGRTDYKLSNEILQLALKI